MDKTYLYIKRLVSFILCAIFFVVLQLYLPFFIVLSLFPLLLLTFSILHSRITGERPPHLFAFYRTDQYFKKGGLRDVLGIFVTIFGFLYDIIVWTFWGVYLVFVLFIDLIDFIKTLIYWVIHAVLWFLRQYVPFFILLYRLFVYYLIRWPWWLYQIAYSNIRFAYNLNCYKVALTGTIQAAFIFFLFYFLDTFLEDIPGIFIIGFIIALLPITWVFGEIANIRVQKLEEEPYRQVRLKFQNGIESVRSILFYITLFVTLTLFQLGLNLLGWVPRSGILIGGFVFNLNTFISLIMLVLCILILFGVLIIPSYRLYNPFSEFSFSHSAKLLNEIFKKFLQYFLVAIPVKVFTVITMLIPLAIILVVYWVSFNIKNSVAEVKINKLKLEQTRSNNPVDAYETGKQIERFRCLQQFPEGLLQEMEDRKNLTTKISFSKEDTESAEAGILLKKEENERKQQDLQNQIDSIKKSNLSDINIKTLLKVKDRLQIELIEYRSAQELSLAKLKIDIKYFELKRDQSPYLFFLGGLWIVIFGSIVAAFGISYIGNVFHQVYIFRNNDKKAEWKNIVERIKEKDHKQPLLGGTLFAITLVLLYILLAQSDFVRDILSQIKSLL